MNNPFHPKHFFETKDFQFAELFESSQTVWEVLQKLKEFMDQLPLGKIDSEVPSGAILVDPECITIGKGVVIEPGCYIKGPCFIGDHSTVRHGAYIRGYCIAGVRTVIGHATEVKHSIFLNDAKAAHFAYIGDCILGNKVNLGAGTKCANLKLDSSEVLITHDDETYSTGLKKLGAIIGDEVQIGCNSVTNPGTFIGKGALCYPSLNFGGKIPAHALVKPSQKATIISLKNSVIG